MDVRYSRSEAKQVHAKRKQRPDPAINAGLQYQGFIKKAKKRAEAGSAHKNNSGILITKIFKFNIGEVFGHFGFFLL